MSPERNIVDLLPEGEPVLWLAMSSLLRQCDADGVAALDRVSRDLRSSYLAFLRDTEHASPERMLDVRRMKTETVASYLKDNLFGRLTEVGRFTEDERSGGTFRFDPAVWPAVQAQRRTLVEEIDRGVVAATEVISSQRTEIAGAMPEGWPSELKANGLVKAFRGRRVVDDVAVRVRQGEVVGLLGPNGAGKTTTFYMIVGLLKADAGSVAIDDTRLTRLPMFKRARAGIGYLSQEPSVFRKLTVEENVMAILETLDVSRDEREQRLEELLNELSIEHLRKNKAYSLSGGERRRLEITRALATRPKFMLLDEPFAGVDPIAVDDIQRIVAELRERGLGVLITDHNVRETLSITDRAYLMFNGRIHIEGPAETLVSDPEARKMYLGMDFEL
jgi:lipopolysaccharide export system ATP-binding protein